jgi:hypothetical protein
VKRWSDVIKEGKTIGGLMKYMGEMLAYFTEFTKMTRETTSALW